MHQRLLNSFISNQQNNKYSKIEIELSTVAACWFCDAFYLFSSQTFYININYCFIYLCFVHISELLKI